MNDRTTFPVNARVIVALLVTSVSALWLAPSSKADSLTMTVPTNNLTVSPGDTIAAGYQVAISKPRHATDTVSMTGVVRISVSCPNGRSESISISLASQSITVPADGNGWYPGNTAYQGQITAPSNLCGGRPGKTNGATFTETHGHSCHKRSNDNEDCHHDHCFRFHIRDRHNGGDHDGDFSNRDCDNDEHECESPDTREKRDDCKEEDDKRSNFVAPELLFQMLGRNLKKESA
jgi:hypothetical protein